MNEYDDYEDIFDDGDDFIDVVSKSRKVIADDVDAIHRAIVRTGHDIFVEYDKYPFLKEELQEVMDAINTCLEALSKLEKVN